MFMRFWSPARNWSMAAATLLVLFTAVADGAPLEISYGQNVRLAAGAYSYDDVIIHGGGVLTLTGDVTLNVDGAVQILREFHQDHGGFIQGYINGENVVPPANGASVGANGANGQNGVETFNNQPGSMGFPGDSGLSSTERGFYLTMNAGTDIVIDGRINLFTGVGGGVGRTGGQGGTGGYGFSPGRRDLIGSGGGGSLGGAGGSGGVGGNGGGASRLVLNAGHSVSLGQYSALYLNAYDGQPAGVFGGTAFNAADAGYGGRGGLGGQGGSANDAGDGGEGGNGGGGGRGGDGGDGMDGGDIFVEAPIITWTPSVALQRGGGGGAGGMGGRGGNGARGGDADVLTGGSYSGLGGDGGSGGVGGNGGNGGDGGRGGNLHLRGVCITSGSPFSRHAEGGQRGVGGFGGFGGRGAVGGVGIVNGLDRSNEFATNGEPGALGITAADGQTFFELTPPALTGDIDLDGDVDGGDAALLAAHFGTDSGSTWCTGDLNADGATTLADLGLLQAHLSQPLAASPGTPATIPEPTSAVLALLALAGTIASRLVRSSPLR